MENVKIVKQYFKKHFKHQFYTENDSEFKDLIEILNKKDKQVLSQQIVSGQSEQSCELIECNSCHKKVPKDYCSYLNCRLNA